MENALHGLPSIAHEITCAAKVRGKGAGVCRICGRPAEKVLNRFYGTGLAVHQYLVDCQHCGLASVDEKAFDASVPAAVAVVRSRFRSFVQRLTSGG